MIACCSFADAGIEWCPCAGDDTQPPDTLSSYPLSRLSNSTYAGSTRGGTSVSPTPEMPSSPVRRSLDLLDLEHTGTGAAAGEVDVEAAVGQEAAAGCWRVCKRASGRVG